MTARPDVVIAMPAFNEELAIPGFLAEIAGAFKGVDFRIVVVNDCSTDNTEITLQNIASKFPLEIHSNPQNTGHGPSTLTALHLAVALKPKHVVTADGDGHLTGQTLWHLYSKALEKNATTVIEGVRTERGEPWFRRAVSTFTRMLVKHYSGESPRDANTPFRVYGSDVLREFLPRIPADHMTPNLMMSALVRQGRISFEEVPIALCKRKGSAISGSTWRQRFRLVPSRRFLQFCLIAVAQWINPANLTKK